MRILKSKKTNFIQKLKNINKYKNQDLKDYKKNKLTNFSKKITQKIPKILLSKISKKMNFKIQDHLQTSNHLLDHLFYIEQDLVNLPKKKNPINLNLDNSLLAMELLNISKLIFGWIEDSKKNIFLSDSKIIQIMDILLAISTDFAYEVGSLEFNVYYSQACEEASEFLFNLHSGEESREVIYLDHFWQIKKLLLFFYESNYLLSDANREVINDIADKITVDMLNKNMERSFSLKSQFLKSNFSNNIYEMIKKNEIFVKNSKLNLETEIKTLSYSLIN